VTPEVLLTALAGMTGLAFGLWLGERGRRKDAQRREGVLKVDEPPRAIVRLAEDQETLGVPGELAEAPAEFLEQTMYETGCSRQQAEQEWYRLLARAGTDSGGGGWIQES
jgi:hypothetical protein